MRMRAETENYKVMEASFPRTRKERSLKVLRDKGVVDDYEGLSLNEKLRIGIVYLLIGVATLIGIHSFRCRR